MSTKIEVFDPKKSPELKTDKIKTDELQKFNLKLKQFDIPNRSNIKNIEEINLKFDGYDDPAGSDTSSLGNLA